MIGRFSTVEFAGPQTKQKGEFGPKKNSLNGPCSKSEITSGNVYIACVVVVA